jgi:hypothetical protein
MADCEPENLVVGKDRSLDTTWYRARALEFISDSRWQQLVGKYWVLHCTHNTFALQASNLLGPFMGTKLAGLKGMPSLALRLQQKGHFVGWGPLPRQVCPAGHSTILAS